jgi:hypothetical protein
MYYLAIAALGLLNCSWYVYIQLLAYKLDSDLFSQGATSDSSLSDIVVISSQSDADDISGCGTIDGDVVVAENYANSLNLSGVTHITGSLVINGTTNITALIAPDLTVIGKDFVLISCIFMTNLTMTEFTLGGFMNFDALPNLQKLNFKSGVIAAGGISVTNTGLTSLVLEITSASSGIYIAANSALTDITFNSLTNTSSPFIIEINNYKLEVNLPNLVAVQNITVSNVASLSIPNLYHSTGQLLIQDSYMRNLSIGLLQTSTTIVVTHNTLLNNISMPDLIYLSGGLTITGNDALKEINGFSSLATVQRNIDVTGNYTE